ncbi:unnamed protein product [Amoebophrya sp. A120]|nr:unnamed protein product [Amoebophrya sp. A120]|eukprot:GSA120T00017883001.1
MSASGAEQAQINSGNVLNSPPVPAVVPVCLRLKQATPWSLRLYITGLEGLLVGEGPTRSTTSSSGSTPTPAAASSTFAGENLQPACSLENARFQVTVQYFKSHDYSVLRAFRSTTTKAFLVHAAKNEDTRTTSAETDQQSPPGRGGGTSSPSVTGAKTSRTSSSNNHQFESGSFCLTDLEPGTGYDVRFVVERIEDTTTTSASSSAATSSEDPLPSKAELLSGSPVVVEANANTKTYSEYLNFATVPRLRGPCPLQLVHDAHCSRARLQWPAVECGSGDIGAYVVQYVETPDPSRANPAKLFAEGSKQLRELRVPAIFCNDSSSEPPGTGKITGRRLRGEQQTVVNLQSGAGARVDQKVAFFDSNAVKAEDFEDGSVAQVVLRVDAEDLSETEGASKTADDHELDAGKMNVEASIPAAENSTSVRGSVNFWLTDLSPLKHYLVRVAALDPSLSKGGILTAGVSLSTKTQSSSPDKEDDQLRSATTGGDKNVETALGRTASEREPGGTRSATTSATTNKYYYTPAHLSALNVHQFSEVLAVQAGRVAPAVSQTSVLQICASHTEALVGFSLASTSTDEAPSTFRLRIQPHISAAGKKNTAVEQIVMVTEAEARELGEQVREVLRSHSADVRTALSASGSSIVDQTGGCTKGATASDHEEGGKIGKELMQESGKNAVSSSLATRQDKKFSDRTQGTRYGPPGGGEDIIKESIFDTQAEQIEESISAHLMGFPFWNRRPHLFVGSGEDILSAPRLVWTQGGKVATKLDAPRPNPAATSSDERFRAQLDADLFQYAVRIPLKTTPGGRTQTQPSPDAPRTNVGTQGENAVPAALGASAGDSDAVSSVPASAAAIKPGVVPSSPTKGAPLEQAEPQGSSPSARGPASALTKPAAATAAEMIIPASNKPAGTTAAELQQQAILSASVTVSCASELGENAVDVSELEVQLRGIPTVDDPMDIVASTTHDTVYFDIWMPDPTAEDTELLDSCRTLQVQDILIQRELEATGYFGSKHRLWSEPEILQVESNFRMYQTGNMFYSTPDGSTAMSQVAVAPGGTRKNNKHQRKNAEDSPAAVLGKNDSGEGGEFLSRPTTSKAARHQLARYDEADLMLRFNNSAQQSTSSSSSPPSPIRSDEQGESPDGSISPRQKRRAQWDQRIRMRKFVKVRGKVATGLLPETRYVFQLAGRTEDGHVGKYQQIEVRTKKIAPSMEQVRLSVHEKNRSSLLLKWENPTFDREDLVEAHLGLNKIIGYHLRHKKKGDASWQELHKIAVPTELLTSGVDLDHLAEVDHQSGNIPSSRPEIDLSTGRLISSDSSASAVSSSDNRPGSPLSRSASSFSYSNLHLVSNLASSSRKAAVDGASKVDPALKVETFHDMESGGSNTMITVTPPSGSARLYRQGKSPSFASSNAKSAASRIIAGQHQVVPAEAAGTTPTTNDELDDQQHMQPSYLLLQNSLGQDDAVATTAALQQRSANKRALFQHLGTSNESESSFPPSSNSASSDPLDKIPESTSTTESLLDPKGSSPAGAVDLMYARGGAAGLMKLTAFPSGTTAEESENQQLPGKPISNAVLFRRRAGVNEVDVYVSSSGTGRVDETTHLEVDGSGHNYSIDDSDVQPWIVSEVENLAPLTTYVFEIAAVTDRGVGAFSNEYSFTTLGPAPDLGKPSAVVVRPNKVLLSVDLQLANDPDNLRLLSDLSAFQVRFYETGLLSKWEERQVLMWHLLVDGEQEILEQEESASSPTLLGPRGRTNRSPFLLNFCARMLGEKNEAAESLSLTDGTKSQPTTTALSAVSTPVQQQHTSGDKGLREHLLMEEFQESKETAISPAIIRDQAGFYAQLMRLRQDPDANLRVFAEITNLQPDRKYIFQVCARTRCGLGKWSVDSEVVATHRLCPVVMKPQVMDTSIAGVRANYLLYHDELIREHRSQADRAIAGMVVVNPSQINPKASNQLLQGIGAKTTLQELYEQAIATTKSVEDRMKQVGDYIDSEEVEGSLGTAEHEMFLPPLVSASSSATLLSLESGKLLFTEKGMAELFNTSGSSSATATAAQKDNLPKERKAELDSARSAIADLPMLPQWVQDVNHRWNEVAVVYNGGMEFRPTVESFISTPDINNRGHQAGGNYANTTNATTSLAADHAVAFSPIRTNKQQHELSFARAANNAGRSFSPHLMEASSLMASPVLDLQHRLQGQPLLMSQLAPTSSSVPVFTDVAIGLAWRCPLAKGNSVDLLDPFVGRNNNYRGKMNQYHSRNNLTTSDLLRTRGVGNSVSEQIASSPGTMGIATSATSSTVGGAAALDSSTTPSSSLQQLPYCVDNIPLYYEIRYRPVDPETLKELGPWKHFRCTANHELKVSENSLADVSEGELVAVFGSCSAEQLHYSENSSPPVSPLADQANALADAILNTWTPQQEEWGRRLRGSLQSKRVQLLRARGTSDHYNIFKQVNFTKDGFSVLEFAHQLSQHATLQDSLRSVLASCDLSEENLSKFSEITTVLVPDLDPNTAYAFQIRPVTHFQLAQLWQKNSKIFHHEAQRQLESIPRGPKIQSLVDISFQSLSNAFVFEKQFSESSSLIGTLDVAPVIRKVQVAETTTTTATFFWCATELQPLLLPKLQLQSFEIQHYSKRNGKISGEVTTVFVKRDQCFLQSKVLDNGVALVRRLRSELEDEDLRSSTSPFMSAQSSKNSTTGGTANSTGGAVATKKDQIKKHVGTTPSAGGSAVKASTSRVNDSNKNVQNLATATSTLQSPPAHKVKINPTSTSTGRDYFLGNASSPLVASPKLYTASYKQQLAQYFRKTEQEMPPFLVRFLYAKLQVINLESATDHFVRIRAVTAAGPGPWSTEKACKTTLALPPPNAPSLIFAQATQLTVVVVLEQEQQGQFRFWDCRLHHMSPEEKKWTSGEFRMYDSAIRQHAPRRILLQLDGLTPGGHYQLQVRGVTADNLTKSSWSEKSPVMETTIGDSLKEGLSSGKADNFGSVAAVGSASSSSSRGERLSGTVASAQLLGSAVSGTAGRELQFDQAGHSRVRLDGGEETLSHEQHNKLLAVAESTKHSKDVSTLSADSGRQLQTSLETILTFVITRALKGVTLASVEYRPVDVEARAQAQMHGGAEEAVRYLIDQAEKYGNEGFNVEDGSEASYGEQFARYANTTQLVDFLVGLIPVVGVPGVFLKDMFFRVRNCALIAELYGVDTLNDLEAQAMILTCLIPGQNIENIHRRNQENSSSAGSADQGTGGGAASNLQYTSTTSSDAPGGTGDHNSDASPNQGASSSSTFAGTTRLDSGSTTPRGLDGMQPEDSVRIAASPNTMKSGFDASMNKGMTYQTGLSGGGGNYSTASSSSGSAQYNYDGTPITNLSEMVDIHDVHDITTAVATAVVKEAIILASGITKFSRLIDIVADLVSYKPGRANSVGASPEALAASMFQPQPKTEQIPYLGGCLFLWLLPIIISGARFVYTRILPIFQIPLLYQQDLTVGLVCAILAIGWTTSLPLLLNAQALRDWATQALASLPAFVVFGIHAALPGIGCFLGARDILTPLVEHRPASGGKLLIFLGSCSILAQYARWCDDVERASMLDEIPPPRWSRYKNEAIRIRTLLYRFLIIVFVWEEILARFFLLPLLGLLFPEEEATGAAQEQATVGATSYFSSGVATPTALQAQDGATAGTAEQDIAVNLVPSFSAARFKVISEPGATLMNYQTIYFFVGLIAATAQEHLMDSLTKRTVLLRLLGARSAIYGGVLALCSGVFAMFNLGATVNFLTNVSPTPHQCILILEIRRIGVFAGLIPVLWSFSKLCLQKNMGEIAVLFALAVGVLAGIQVVRYYHMEELLHRKTIFSSYRILLLFPHTSSHARSRAEQAMELAMRRTAVTSAKGASGFVAKSLVRQIFNFGGYYLFGKK